jgi:POT family proton-dependent oligopeptide transporter
MHAATAAALASDRNDRAFLGHPRGLGYLAFAEGWERFSYYGMQTLLVLYMVKHLLLPGHIEQVAGFAAFHRWIETLYGPLSGQALASAIFGLYAGLVYLTPLFGGMIADRWLGKTRTIMLGATLMAAGHFAMAFDGSFLIALALLLAGVGCFKGNLAAQIGELYVPGDLRRADAFQIYYLAINAAVIVSPLVCGTLGEVWGWHYGFGAAGVGMVIGLAVYLSGRRWLPVEVPIVRAERVERPPMTRTEKKTVLLLIALVPVLAAGVIGNQEIFNAYLVWGEYTYAFVLFGHTVPTTWLVTLDAIVSVSFLLLAVVFWRWWAKRRPEPAEITKITIGTFISVSGMLALAAASALAASTGHKVSLIWALLFHTLNSIGFANVLPVSLALYARAAPRALAGTLIAIYYLHLFVGNMAVGKLGGLLDKMPDTQFWLLHAAIIAASGVVLLIARFAFGHLLQPGGRDAG